MKKRKEKEFSLIKILISILFGFLPSFIFISLLIQYGNPFVNYFEFLFNFNASIGAWISAVLISLFAYFIIGVIGSKNLFKRMLNNRILFGIIIFCFVVAFVLFFIQLYLYANFVLKNDMLVELSSDKENIFFTNNSQEEITFNVNLLMNLFCSAQCEYQFLDLSFGEVIERGSFSTTILSKSKSYKIDSKNFVEGSQELRQFEISCKSKKTLLCYTNERESKRKILVTINYELTEEEKEFKDNSRGIIENISELLYFSKGNLDESIRNIYLIDDYFLVEDFLNKHKELQESYNNLNSSLKEIGSLWKLQEFDKFKDRLPEIKIQTEDLINETEKLKLDISLRSSLYNILAETMISSKEILNGFLNMSLENSECVKLNEIISNYNHAIINFKTLSSIGYKENISKVISNEINNFSENYVLGEEKCVLENNVSSVNLEKIKLTSIELPNKIFLLNDPDTLCCLNDKCEKCLGNESSDKNYPILFLHGQSINEAISVGYSFDAFSKVKEKLVTENYIDAGSIVINPIFNEGLWGKLNSSLIMTGSYFFDTYKTDVGEVTVSSNKEGIDTYAIRLNKLIELIKLRTNKDKVIIAAHSMGGVVTRRYIQLFGNKDVDKVILVTVPNHGVEDKVKEYCGVIGPEASCNDLDRNGIFINELNNEPTENVPIYNIVGIGCNMGNEFGDGVIKNSSQYLESAENYYFEGVCNEINFEFFHEYILFPEIYPEVYNKIYEILQNP
jgi:hypothetical protein